MITGIAIDWRPCERPRSCIPDGVKRALIAGLGIAWPKLTIKDEVRTVFPTKKLRDEAVEKYHAIEGGQQTLSNLAAYVSEIVRKGVEG